MNVGINGRFLCAPITGVQRFGHELLARLPDRTQTTLLVPSNAIVPDYYTGRVIRGRLSGNVWEQLELVDNARTGGCDVVVHPANTLPLRAHRSVVVAHDPLFPVSNPEWFTTRYVLWHRHIIAHALRRASAILTVSEWSRRMLAVNARLPLLRIGVVPQGLAPFDTPAPAHEVARVRALHGITGPYVLAMGGRDPRKNIRFLTPLIAALPRVTSTPVQFIVVGDAHARVHPPDTDVRAAAEVRLLGPMSPADTHAFLTGASAFLFPSLAESFGRPPLEAIACGTPALVGAYHAAAEVVGSAAHVLTWDAELWARTLVDVLADPHARERALEQAQPLRARFSWDRTTDVVFQSCEHVVARRALVHA
jgi:glycosyltransferase involved in cell wall biosynthesis